MQPIIITGIGTGIGKTLVSAIITEALQADYWKPVQAGYENGTDSEWIKEVISNSKSKIHPETYKLKLAASPHIAAREEGVRIELGLVETEFKKIRKKELEISNNKVAAGQRSSTNDFLIIEGAGGLMVPLNEKEF
ncbi:MAG TPA: AAA family ATPase, partial [Puia sp.]|nr:AAA family ATPase [Puia sp.]